MPSEFSVGAHFDASCLFLDYARCREVVSHFETYWFIKDVASNVCYLWSFHVGGDHDPRTNHAHTITDLHDEIDTFNTPLRTGIYKF